MKTYRVRCWSCATHPQTSDPKLASYDQKVERRPPCCGVCGSDLIVVRVLREPICGHVSDKAIRDLRREAGEAGDLAMARICDQALKGDRDSRVVCLDAILAAREAEYNASERKRPGGSLTIIECLDENSGVYPVRRCSRPAGHEGKHEDGPLAWERGS